VNNFAKYAFGLSPHTAAPRPLVPLRLEQARLCSHIGGLKS
jgi:hypothetical protein